MKVEAELKTMYKVTVGHDGMCYGNYDASDEWEQSYYDENLKVIAEILSVEHFTGLPKRKFDFEQVEVLIYNDIKYDYRIIKELLQYNKNSEDLKQEYKEFMQYWEELESDRQKMKEIQKSKNEREEKLAKIKREEEKKAKELENYLKLKEKFEK